MPSDAYNKFLSGLPQFSGQQTLLPKRGTAGTQTNTPDVADPNFMPRPVIKSNGKTDFAMYYLSLVNQALGKGDAEAKRLNAEEEKRGASMEDIIKQALPAANAPTWNQEAINNALGLGQDAGAQSFLGGSDALRSYLGGAGITGGGQAQGMLQNLELSRLGQATDSRRAVYLQVTKDQALDRARNFQNSLTYANAVNRTPSSVYMQHLGDVAGIRLGQQGVEAQGRAASKAASAAKGAGWMSLLTDVVGVGAKVATGGLA